MKRLLAILVILVISQAAFAADPSYVVVGRLAQTPPGQPIVQELSAVRDLLARQRPPIPIARMREGQVNGIGGMQRYVGVTVPYDALERVLDLGLEPAPPEFVAPARPVD